LDMEKISRLSHALRKIKVRRTLNAIHPALPRRGVERVTVYRSLFVLHIGIKDADIYTVAPPASKTSKTMGEAKTLPPAAIT